jgi:hypothetical protein
MKLERIIGIDFGTSTSFVKVKRYIDGKPFGGDNFETKAMVFDGKGSIAVPTVVQKAEEQFWFGYEAEAKKPNGMIYRNFKVDLESKDPKTCELAKEMTERFFRYIYEKYDEQRKFFGDSSDEEKTIVSYPAKWQEETRRFMIEAAQKAGFSNVAGIDEATAAIDAVMIQEAGSLQEKGYLQADVPATIMLIDMGAGTTDLALCRYTVGASPKNEIIATWPKADGDILFGGREVDEILCENLTEYLAQNGMLESVVNTLKTLRMGEIKSWKEHTVSDTLDRSGRVESCAVLDGLYMMLGMNPPPFPAIDRSKFEEMAHDYLVQYTKLINGCIEHAMEIAPDFKGSESIDMVVLTGGHSQWYFAKDVLTGSLKSLGEVNLPRICGEESRVLRMARPQETVSLGLVYSTILPEVKPAQKIVHEEQKKELISKVISRLSNYAKAYEEQQEYDLRYGNTCGNIVNGGNVVQKGKWVYYSNYSDGKKIYKMHSNGSQNTKLNDTESEYINVVNDWVYYYNESEDNIYKMRTDGTKSTKLNDDGGVYINVVNDWIYYCNASTFNIYKMRIDGTEKTKLNDDESEYINVVGEWIYYLNYSDNGKPYKIHTDGTEKTKLNDDKSEYINVVGEWIYYSNYSDDYKLYKMRTDGTEKIKINGDGSGYINVANKWVYYCNKSDGYNLYKIRTDGTKKEKLDEGRHICSNIFVVGEWIYYEKFDISDLRVVDIYEYWMYKININGTGKKLVGKYTEKVSRIVDNIKKVFKL